MSEKIEIDAIFVRSKDDEILIRTDETCPGIWIPKHGIKVVKNGDACIAGLYCTITLTERKAANYGLI